MTKRVIICENPKCGREIVTEIKDGKVLCRGCRKRTEV